MIKVGDQFPKFHLTAVVSNDIDDAFVEINEESYKGKWQVIFFWPKDFTFICPTEILAFDAMLPELEKRNAVLLGGSTDNEFVHLEWRRQKLPNIKFPMLSDLKRDLSTALGILDENEGVSQRATFILDPEGIVRFSMVTDLSVGRNPQEVLRVLDALQEGGLCPCNWNKGDETLTPS
ncbi:MAG: peroxiredoxin [Alphaproteobacteria bacterium]|nr:MAG: peroxiredoxin [Alphaproteobacteria bacterium]